MEGANVAGHLNPDVGPLLARSSSFRIGGVSVGFKGGREADIATVPPLALFRCEQGPLDIDVQIEWVSSLQPAGRLIFDSGSTWRLYRSDHEFRFDFSAPFFGEEPYKRLVMDANLRRGAVQMNNHCSVRSSFPGAALSYPLDELLIMHRLTQERAIEVHSCGIVRPDGLGNLFVGHSGAGKSTTTRLWTSHENVEVLSDDRIILREHSGQIFMYGTPWHGEAHFASPNRALVQRIFILEHGCGNVLTRLSPSQAVTELFARSFVPFYRHEYIDSALDFLQQVVSTIPCYRYAFEPDPRAVERIVNFRD